ncbi:DUF3085 domain-containing protein [Sphingomonas sp. 3-13AW]|uniref:DUF3085 domain-containing protein n=1 Tax=Sphingomonas sp. 3-13AW TaxID=3050450 RepID=UPI003BB7AB5C
MAGILTFLVDDTLRTIVHHARNSPTRRPCYAELYDPACRKDGKEPDGATYPSQDDVDPAKIPAGLWLVKDQGVYLMSPGEPFLKNRSGDSGMVAYAFEAGPDDYDMARAIMGGDDGVDKIGLDVFEAAIKLGNPKVFIHVSDTELSVSL